MVARTSINVTLHAHCQSCSAVISAHKLNFFGFSKNKTMKAMVLLLVSKGIRLAFYVTRVLVAKILHCQWQLKNLKTKSNDGMVLTESSRRGWKGPRGKKGVHGKISVLLSLCPPQIPHESPWDREPLK